MQSVFYLGYKKLCIEVVPSHRSTPHLITNKMEVKVTDDERNIEDMEIQLWWCLAQKQCQVIIRETMETQTVQITDYFRFCPIVQIAFREENIDWKILITKMIYYKRGMAFTNYIRAFWKNSVMCCCGCCYMDF